MRVGVAALAVVMLLGACLPPAGRLFHTTLIHTSTDNPAGDYPLPIVLGDETGLVVAIESAGEIDSAPGLDLTVQADPSDPKAIVAIWLGGLCDNDATLSFRQSGSGYTLHLEVHGKLGFGCTAAGIGRAVRIKTSEPLPIGQITAGGHG